MTGPDRAWATQRFTALMDGPEARVPLDEMALLIAAHARPSLSIADEQERLDRLADATPVATVEGVLVHLFADLGFQGNAADYGDPDNSYLDAVLRRRLGIPITLALVAVEVGRRRGVGLHLVGMPGHVLLGAEGVDGAWWDPFDGGTRLDQSGCLALYRGIAGPGATLRAADLLPSGPFAIAARMLANLERSFQDRRDRRSLVWAQRLRSRVPGVPLVGRRELASTLAADGRFDEAAAELDALVDLAATAGDQALAEEAAAGATRLRARLN